MPQGVFSSRSGRRIFGRAQNDAINDPYQAQQKPQEPSVCGDCGAVYHHGRWQWAAKPSDAHPGHCPACRRIKDDLPAGVVTLHGAFAMAHKAELIGLAQNEEAAEKGEHALNRIIGIEETGDGLVIRTTDIHLPRRLGTAIKRAFDGDLDIHFDEGGYFVRIDWTRSA